MITGREWRQIITALAHTGAYVINDQCHISLGAMISILRTFAEPGCEAQLMPDGTVSITSPSFAEPLRDPLLPPPLLRKGP